MNQDHLTPWEMDDNESPSKAAGGELANHDPSDRLVDAMIVAALRPAAADALAVTRIMARIADTAAPARPEPRRRHSWAHVATAALVLMGLLAPLWLWQGLPEAHATMRQAADHLGAGIDRRFAVEIEAVAKDGAREQMQSLQLLARPGGRFVVSGPLDLGPMHLSAMRFGCDGREFWFHSFGRPGQDPELRRQGPLDEAPEALRPLGSLFASGLLDVHAVVSELPRDLKLRTERRYVDGDGNRLVVVEAKGGPRAAGYRLRRARVHCCEVTGRIVRLDVEAEVGGGRTQRLRFSDRGQEHADESVYRRPW